MAVRVKICGITSLEDALAVAEAGADAVGFVFYRRSPRYVTPERAEAIVRQLPPFITTVGLFVDESGGQVEAIRRRVGLDCLQFHGNESQNYLAQFPCRVIKAIRMASPQAARRIREYQASAILVDSYRPGEPGGTGATFDWSWLAAVPPGVRIVLAGGLTPENVGEAIATCRPYAVDCSSGVEKAPGVKDPRRVAAFVRAVRAAEGAPGRLREVRRV
ncbi:MAG: phosphoribosylanthranilate isomerase [Nitrospirae bacterium]|nr:MAG: phosphoribosylanthranilate isomerase [Nitrospirota bacterium]